MSRDRISEFDLNLPTVMNHDVIDPNVEYVQTGSLAEAVEQR